MMGHDNAEPQHPGQWRQKGGPDGMDVQDVGPVAHACGENSRRGVAQRLEIAAARGGQGAHAQVASQGMGPAGDVGPPPIDHDLQIGPFRRDPPV